jgi:hypothetical protein
MDEFRLEFGARLMQDGTYRPIVGSGGLVFWESEATYDSHSAAVNAADSALRGALASLLSQREPSTEQTA